MNQLGFPPAQATLPDKLPCSCKADRFVLPGGSRWSRLAAWPFRSPAGKKNIIGGRGHRQIKRRGSRTLAQGPSPAFAQRPRSQATRTTPHGPQIRSRFTAGQPERADRCCRLMWGCTRVTARGNMTFLRMKQQVRANVGRCRRAPSSEPAALAARNPGRGAESQRFLSPHGYLNPL